VSCEGCEGCEARGLVLTLAGYCPACAAVACAQGSGDMVGLPVPCDLEGALARLRQHVVECVVPVDSCPVCVFLAVECGECDKRTDAMGPADAELHELVGPRPDEPDAAEYVAVACKGYVLPPVRAVVL
jgi:hypothetical protein